MNNWYILYTWFTLGDKPFYDCIDYVKIGCTNCLIVWYAWVEKRGLVKNSAGGR